MSANLVSNAPAVARWLWLLSCRRFSPNQVNAAKQNEREFAHCAADLSNNEVA